MNMWPFCMTAPWFWSLLPLLFGFLTGWWIWARMSGSGSASADLAFAAPDPAPAAPVMAKPEPVAFKAPDPKPVAFKSPEPEPVAAPKPAPVERPAEAKTPKAAGGVVALAAGGAALTAIGIPAAVGDPDDLLLIKGIGPKLNKMLIGLGITRFDQIAAWTPQDVDKVDDHMGQFKDRIGREEWIPQAKLLAAGNMTEWERLYGTVKVAAGAGVAAMLAIGIPGAVGDPDDLLQIKGIGPKLNSLLVSLGITRFDQIAAWGAAEIDKVDDHLGTFKNRITRDAWVEQAGLLASGKIAEFEAKFGKLDSENQK
jgi:predicted flap endonuclease-1-like 5' DNA nuclease